MSELDPSLRALVREARALEDPSPGDRARLRTGLMKRVGTAAFMTAMSAGTAATAGGVAAASWTTGAVFKAVLVVAVVGGAGAGVVHEVRARAAERAASRPIAVAPAPLLPAIAPTAPPAPEPPNALPAATVSFLSTARAPHRAHGAARPSTKDGASTLDDEVALIGRAQTALNANDPQSALSALDDHAARYPKGQLADEREGLRALAACSLGAEGARRRAELFTRSHPQSPLVARIRVACEPK